MTRIVRTHSQKNPGVNPTSISPRQMPSVSYTMQNLFISLATIAVSSASLFFTLFVFLPLACLRALLPLNMKVRLSELRRNKVVLVLGASRGIGFNLVKQYANEKGTVIIAASSSMDILRKSIISLGETPASIQCHEMNLTWPHQKIADGIRAMDRLYGPITHIFEVGGLSNNIQDWAARSLNETREMISANINGTVTAILATYDLMKDRGYGKICVVGSLTGIVGPANMVSYASIKSFINTFTTSLRLLAAPCGVDVVCVQPGFIDAQMTRRLREQGGQNLFGSAEDLAARMKEGVEKGGRGIVIWPESHGAVMYALRGVNPICEELLKWVLMRLSMGKQKNN
ncbi:hypothetical protein M413DRAFT_79337 [Hebeloma cylindrosporum]|uniref:NAD(P)-binding protein n=1 Tax=Hebeloma cylindrosporum TaxID=76867 RepID=A0A0C3BTU7_HEBCY|nr:hypothetical protein M413DRAFT_79337 [Hebeloma cylindrosporum h7]